MGKIVLDTGWIENPDSLNPFVGYALTSYYIYWLNYDRLVRYDAETLEPVPGIAESGTSRTTPRPGPSTSATG